MKALLIAAVLTAMLLAPPAGAQQGPAGVPGAPGLAPPPPPPPVPAAVDVEPAVAKAGAPRQSTQAACRQSKGKTGQACPSSKKKSPAGCATSADPARCEQYRKTRELCRKVPEADYRQCLRDNLSAPK